MEKITKGLPPIIRPKLSEKAQYKKGEIENNMRIIGIGMIGNSNYIGPRLNGSIQEVK